jgi:hypothetical protein
MKQENSEKLETGRIEHAPAAAAGQEDSTATKKPQKVHSALKRGTNFLRLPKI